MLKYSVVIPIYNVESYLGACIDSVLAQDAAADYEIILIDDGSPDGSGVICDRYAQEYPQIRVLHDTNHGVSHARNTGLEMAQGEYVLFLDADDLWEPGMFGAVEQLTEKKADLILFGHNCLYENGTKVMWSLQLKSDGESGEAYLYRLFENNLVPYFYPWCYLYRREFLNAHKIRFREDLKVSEDFEFNMRVFAAAKHLECTPAALYQYRIRSGSVTATLSEKKLMDNLTTKAEYFRRYPVAAMADLYAANAVLIAELPETDSAEAMAFLKENRDIWKYVSDKSYKLGRLFVTLLGDRNGARMYYAVRSIVRKLQHRSEI